MNTLRQLFYLSRADAALNAGGVQQILSVSQRNNRQKDITGCLLYSGRHFAQVLEGQPASLAALLSRLAQDPRHRDMVVAIDQEVSTRSFPDWSMGILFKLDVADRIEALLADGDLPADQAVALFDEIKLDAVMGRL